MSAIAASSLSR